MQSIGEQIWVKKLEQWMDISFHKPDIWQFLGISKYIALIVIMMTPVAMMMDHLIMLVSMSLAMFVAAILTSSGCPISQNDRTMGFYFFVSVLAFTLWILLQLAMGWN